MICAAAHLFFIAAVRLLLPQQIQHRTDGIDTYYSRRAMIVVRVIRVLLYNDVFSA